jgi:hypothetical protein
MINKNLKIVDIKLLKGFFSNGFCMIACSITFIALVAIYFLVLQKPDLVIYPDLKEFKPVFYNDSVDNGMTEITQTTVSDSVISMHFILKDGFLRHTRALALRSQPCASLIFRHITA